MKEFFLIGGVQAIFLSLLIITKRDKSLPDFVLTTLLVFSSLPLFYYYVNYESTIAELKSFHEFPNRFFFINAPIAMFFTPMIYIYVKSHFVTSEKFIRRNIIHILPIAVFILLTVLFVDFDEVKTGGFYHLNPLLRYIFIAFIPLMFVLMLYYTLQSFKLIGIYSKKIKDNYSSLEDVDLNWLRRFLIITTILLILYVPVGFTLIQKGYLVIVYQMVLALLAGSVFFIAFFGIRQFSVFMVTDLKHNGHTANDNEEKTENLSDDAIKLKEYMEKHKPYLEYKLSLSQLATMLGWNASYLSKILNKELNKNFYEFVNNYRVEEVKKLLESNTKYSNLGIAFECGFNSKSSFHRIFKEVTGLTPNEYRKSIKNTNN